MSRKKKSIHIRLLGEDNLGALQGDDEIVLDLETSGLSPFRDKIAVTSLYGLKSKTGVVIHNRGKMSPALKKFIGTRKLIIGHNLAAFDLLFLNNYGVDVFTPAVYDSMLAELCILSTDRRDVSVNLKSTLNRRTGVKIAKNADHGSWMNPNLTAEQLDYCFDDIEELGNLRKEQIARADDDQLNAMDVEHSLVPGIVKMVSNGMPIDVKKLNIFLYGNTKEKVLGQQDIIDRLEGKLNKKFGGPINFNSPVQLKKALVGLGYNFESTAAQVLEDQAQFGGEIGEICSDILEIRHAGQRLKMYKPEWIDKFVTKGKIHPQIWACSTDTGRMSSSNPNCQQIPADMRSVFGGVPGHNMVWADFSQLEVRVAAAVSNCPGLMEVFNKGLHVHTDIASKAFHCKYEDVTEALIRLAKGLTFTLLFGGGWESFQQYAKRAGYDLSDMECQKIFFEFFRAYPGMRDLKDTAKRMSAQHKRTGKPVVLRLPTGLKRVLMGWKASPSRIMNTLIQSGAAAGLKFGIIECHRRGLTDYLSAAIHDELLAVVPNKLVKEYSVELAECMEFGMAQIMDVSAPVVVKSANYWGK
jgi:DNA polymerase I